VLAQVGFDRCHDRGVGRGGVGQHARCGWLPREYPLDGVGVACGQRQPDHAAGAEPEHRCRRRVERGEQRGGVVGVLVSAVAGPGVAARPAGAAPVVGDHPVAGCGQRVGLPGQHGGVLAATVHEQQRWPVTALLDPQGRVGDS
jgi:hypothetical protein